MDIEDIGIMSSKAIIWINKEQGQTGYRYEVIDKKGNGKKVDRNTDKQKNIYRRIYRLQIKHIFFNVTKHLLI